jgi:hypothetical protein
VDGPILKSWLVKNIGGGALEKPLPARNEKKKKRIQDFKRK